MKNIAIVLAGGVGRRSGLSVPKQFFKVAGKTVIEHTVSAFEQNQNIDEIYIVVHRNYIELVENFCLENSWKKVSKILNGGNERYESSLSAINACDEEECNMIFHDAVRPLVNNRIINDVVKALESCNAVDVAIPQTDTVIKREDNFIIDIPDRASLCSGQTPQAFKLSVIKEAYSLAMKDPALKVTDDCGVVKRYLPNEKIYIVLGESQNIKVTYNEDIFLLDKLFQIKSEKNISERIGVSIEGKVAVVFGGSYGIGKAVVDELESRGCKTFSFSRSENGVDIANLQQVEDSFKKAYKEAGRIDLVINTAALLIKKHLCATTPEEVHSIVNVNFIGMVNVATASYPYLKETAGALLLYTSSSYTRGRSFYSLYSASKAAVVNFTQAIAQEWEGDKIRVNCICPGRTKTPMRVKNFGIEKEETLLKVEEVALASVRALLVNETGQVYQILNTSK